MKKIIRYLSAGCAGLSMVGLGLIMCIPPSERSDSMQSVQEEGPDLLASFASLE